MHCYKLFVFLVFILAACSSMVDKESKYAGEDVYPYVSVDKLSRTFKRCDGPGCSIYLVVDTTMYNPTSRPLKVEVTCTYYWGTYEHGKDTSRMFNLSKNSKTSVKFFYTMSVPFNETSKIGVGCDAKYMFNMDDMYSYARYGFDSTVVKFYRTRKVNVWKSPGSTTIK